MRFQVDADQCPLFPNRCQNGAGRRTQRCATCVLRCDAKSREHFRVSDEPPYGILYGLGVRILTPFQVSFGYVMAANLLWRFVWAFFGNRYTRWRGILPGCPCSKTYPVWESLWRW